MKNPASSHQRLLYAVLIPHILIGSIGGGILWWREIKHVILQIIANPHFNWDVGSLGVSFATTNIMIIILMKTDPQTLAKQLAWIGMWVGAIITVFRIGVLLHDLPQDIGNGLFSIMIIIGCIYSMISILVAKIADAPEIK